MFISKSKLGKCQISQRRHAHGTPGLRWWCWVRWVCRVCRAVCDVCEAGEAARLVCWFRALETMATGGDVFPVLRDLRGPYQAYVLSTQRFRVLFRTKYILMVLRT